MEWYCHYTAPKHAPHLFSPRISHIDAPTLVRIDGAGQTAFTWDAGINLDAQTKYDSQVPTADHIPGSAYLPTSTASQLPVVRSTRTPRTSTISPEEVISILRLQKPFLEPAKYSHSFSPQLHNHGGIFDRAAPHVDAFSSSPIQNDTVPGTQPAVGLESRDPRITPSGRSSQDTLTSAQWERARPQIKKLYIAEQRTLGVVIKIMTSRGFKASENMYKKRFRKWGQQDPEWLKNRKTSKSSASTTTTLSSGTGSALPTPSSTPLAAIKTQTSHLLTLSIDSHLDKLLRNVRSIYQGSVQQKRWKLDNSFEVLEDEYDELFIAVVETIRTPRERRDERAALQLLSSVIQEPGLFALPVIWVCVLRMMRANCLELATKFLVQAGNLARDFGCLNPFVAVIAHLLCLRKRNRAVFESALVSAYEECIDSMSKLVQSSNLTFLSLQGFYINYVNKTSRRVDAARLEFQKLVKDAEEKYGKESDVTLEIMGQQLFLLQSHPEAWKELEDVAFKMARRISKRRKKERLEGTLLNQWKDLQHVLATHWQNRGQSRVAIKTLMDYFDQDPGGEEDGFDRIARSRLEEWGTHGDANET